ncbi:GGDEF domain-containing protein [Pseudoalteromonas phenolica]|uniref:GGDEF domain-containing protein n=1 Tax=Pseudoalteromonas phenolica TaxID=161398 RepID=UPI00110A4C8D|nr:GGDEF domain-containing protein [Pseudoalteromonas phenolica]TMN91439.1 GGDEF domain-containing protein [Pseudoalteromonas phenolica]
MTDKDALIEKKLQQAVKARAALEDAHKDQITTFSNFAARLAVSCKGQDVALDNQLAKFRQALTKGVSFDDLAPLINNITKALKNQEIVNAENHSKLSVTISEAGKQLQKLKGIPDDTRRKLRYLLDTELPEVNVSYEFLPVFEKLITIYKKVLSSKVSLDGDNATTSKPELASELLTLTNEITFEDDVAKEVTDIKTTLSQSAEIDVLLDCSIAIIQIIANSIARERQSAQGFLVSLNQTLEELHASIINTTNSTKHMSEELSGLNKQIETKIKLLNEQTQKATSISDLKELVDGELKLLRQDLVKREQLEQQDKAALLDSFEQINTRIGVLETKVNKYKKRLSEQQFKSLLDGLTKLPNRAAFDDRFNQEFHMFEQHGGDITLVVIDVDYFKSINDQYGHSAGDKTLQVIARALKKAIRKADFIARYGGEEFVLIMSGMPISHAKAPLEKVRNTIKAIPFKFKNKQVQITVSLGATQFKKGDTPLAAFDRADDALYEAKNNGRDRLCIRN